MLPAVREEAKDDEEEDKENQVCFLSLLAFSLSFSFLPTVWLFCRQPMEITSEQEPQVQSVEQASSTSAEPILPEIMPGNKACRYREWILGL